MTISFVGGATDNANAVDTSTLVLTLPSHNTNDFGLVMSHSDSVPTAPTQALTVATGWTEIRNDNPLDGRDRVEYLWRKKFTSGSETDPEITQSAAFNHSALVGVFRGVDTTQQLDVTEQFGSGANSATPTNVAITTVTDDCCIVLLMAVTQGAAIDFVAPTGYTLGPCIDVTNGAGADPDEFIAMAYLLNAGAAGTKTPTAWQNTGGNTTADFTVYTLALRPAVGGGGSAVPVFRHHYNTLQRR